MQGKRPSMEDAHATIDDLTVHFGDLFSADVHGADGPRSFYGIYDGHRGQRAALHAAEHLHRVILRRPEFASNNITDALFQGFVQADQELLAQARAEGGWNDGCTVAVAVVLGRRVYVANVGDAEVLLARQMIKDDGQRTIDVVVLSKVHKPTDPEGARDRQRSADAAAQHHATDGEVTVGKLISEEPYVSATDLLPGRDSFILIGCDGIWESMSHRDSIDFVETHLRQEGPQRTSEMLCEHAIARGSADNVSATILALNWS